MAIVIDYSKDIVHEIEVDLHGKTHISTVETKQYDDKARYIVASVWDDGEPYVIPTGTTVMFRATKPDGLGIANMCEIINGKIVYQITLQTTIVAGEFEAEFGLYNTANGETKAYSTPTFKMVVGKSALPDGTILSTSEVNVLTELIADASTTIAKMNGLVTTINTATTNANIATTSANNAATNANSKATLANTATTNANTARDNANAKATLADQKATLADTAATNANAKAILADTAATSANNAATNANSKATLANTAATNATNATNQINQETLKIYKASVATFANISTTYPSPQNGWVVVTRDNSYEYRYNGTSWVNIGVGTPVDIATDEATGLVKGNGNVGVQSDGAMWADPYKDKGKVTGKFVNFQFTDDALAQIDSKGVSEQVKTQQGNNQINKIYVKQRSRKTSTTTFASVEEAYADVYVSSTRGVYCDPFGKVIVIKIDIGETLRLLFDSTKINLAVHGFLLSDNIYTYKFDSGWKTSSYTYTATELLYCTIYVRDAVGDLYTQSNVESADIAVYKNNTSLNAIEPFVPNSPSVEYPSPIVSPAPFDIVSIHENFAPIATSTRSLGGVTFTPQSNGGILINGTATTTADYYVFHKSYTYNTNSVVLKGKEKYICSFGNSVSVNNLKLYVSYYDLNGGAKYSADLIPFEVPDTQIIAGMFIRTTAGVTYDNVLVYPKLEQGTTATPYTDYKEDKINIPYPMRSLPNGTCDEIIDGNHIQRVGVYTIKGTESFNFQNVLTNSREVRIAGSIIGLKTYVNGATNFSRLMCDKFKVTSSTLGIDTPYICGIAGSNSELIAFRLPVDVSPAVWFAENPTTIHFELANPIITPINTYLKTWKGTTNIFTTAIPPVEITARFMSQLSADLLNHKKAIESKFESNKVLNNDTATIPGFAWDAVRGAAIRRDVDALITAVGDIAALTTTEKTSVVKAINEVNNTLGKKHAADGSSCAGYTSLLQCIIANPNKTLKYNGHGYTDAPSGVQTHWATVNSFGYEGNGITVLFTQNGLNVVYQRKINNGVWVSDWQNNDLNTVLTPTMNTSYGTIISGGYIKSGRLVTIDIRVNVTAEVPGFQGFVPGFPTAITGMVRLHGIKSDGQVTEQIYFDYGNIASLGNLPIGEYVINGTYITAS